LINPPDAATVLAHDAHNVTRAFDGLKVDDRVVAEAKLVDVIDIQVKVELIAVLVGFTHVLWTPVLVAVIVGARVDDHDEEAHYWQRSSPGICA